MAEFRGLGFDPAPGSPDAVAEAARRCSAAAARLGDVPAPSDLPGWAGPAAQALAERARQSAAGVAELPRSLREAAAVLEHWAGTLVAHRRQAEDLDRRARTAQRAVVDAEDAVEQAETTAQFSPAAAPEAAAARARLAARQDELDRVRRAARDLERAHTAEAARVAGRLRALGGNEPMPSPPPFRQLTTALENFSAAGRELGVTVARTPVTPVTPPSGAVGAFTAALGGR
ncbi:hypothetical protein [Amycolatopsis vancoresmycina]|uniref:hypothetical protein n=1 Tax=Amycolatopsis vancoresmycina TaxID=208444 RepID=UPI00052660EA|nr:hypothetical protein [Amycolatopsis vancoresmycina]